MTVKLYWLGWVNLAKDDVINYWLGLIANSFPNMRLKEFKFVVSFATGITVAFLAVQADGGEVLTVEGLEQEGQLHPLQQAFSECHGLQCGYCTPGMLMRAHELLQNNPTPTRDEVRTAISADLCRCTGYKFIIDAVMDAATATGNE